MTSLTVYVQARPVPQGSKRHVGGGRVIEMANDRLKEYRRRITQAAHAAHAACIPHTTPTFTTPVTVEIVFAFQRPRSHYTTKGNLKPSAPLACYPAKRGDLDKLTRAVLDALTGPALKDDAQVTRIDASVDWAALDSTHITITGSPA